MGGDSKVLYNTEVSLRYHCIASEVFEVVNSLSVRRRSGKHFQCRNVDFYYIFFEQGLEFASPHERPIHIADGGLGGASATIRPSVGGITFHEVNKDLKRSRSIEGQEKLMKGCPTQLVVPDPPSSNLPHKTSVLSI